MREVLLASVHRLELGPIYRNACFTKEMEISAQHSELPTDVTNSRAAVLAEVSNGFEVRCQTACQPNQFNIATALTLQSARRLDLIEIAIEIKLEHQGWVIAGPTCCLGHDIKAKLGEVQRIDEGVNHTNRIVFVY